MVFDPVRTDLFGECGAVQLRKQITAKCLCLWIFAEAVVGLSLYVLPGGCGRVEDQVVDHPLYRLLHDEPNQERPPVCSAIPL